MQKPVAQPVKVNNCLIGVFIFVLLRLMDICKFFKPNTQPNAVPTIPYSKPQRGRGGPDRIIKFKSFLQNTIYDALKGRGWQEVSELVFLFLCKVFVQIQSNGSFDRGSDDWDLYWVDVGSMKELFDHGYFEEHMRINHFRNHYEVNTLIRISYASTPVNMNICVDT
jgi:hypothetical protein